MSISLKEHAFSKRDEDHPVFDNLVNHPLIKKIYPMYELPRPQWTRKSHDNKFPYENKISQINQIHEKLGITGKDVLVGVLDSGVDYNHPALGGGFGPGFKIKYGKNLVDEESDAEYGLEPLGSDDPFDPCTLNDAGHGTHVSGIIAGYAPEKNFFGIAPNATLGVWRIFGCEGGASEGTVIKAMEMAFKAGCDVINLSLGVENGWPENAMAVAAERLAKQGVIIIGVAGNQGSDGVYSQNSPATGRHVVSVASIDNEYYPTRVLVIDEMPSENFRYTFSSSTSHFPNGTLVPIYHGGEISTGCSKEGGISGDYAGQIVFIKRGGCTFDEKMENVYQSGAEAAIFYDPAEKTENIVVAKTDNDTLPLIGIDSTLSNKIIDYFKSSISKKLRVSFPDKMAMYHSKTSGMISDFSSTGPTYELDLKPTISGVGGEVYSTVPLHIDNGWSVRAGTSMACPHVAGSAALMVEYQRKNSKNDKSAYIIEQMQNHAKLVTVDGYPDHPLAQGAGLVQAYDSMLSPIHISPSQLSFNDTSSTKDKKQTLMITNSQPYDILVTIENIPSRSIQTFANDTSFIPTAPAFKNGSASIAFSFAPSQKTLTIPASSALRLDVTALLPDSKITYYHYQMYGGFLSINDASKGNSLATLPYFGVLGRMKDLPLFDKGYPYLASSKDTSMRIQNSKGFSFNIKDSTHRPTVVVRLLTGSALMHALVYDAENNNFVGYLSTGPWSFNQRNTMEEGSTFSTMKWTGKVVSKADGNERSKHVPKGRYYIVLKALKHFGDPNNPKDWEEWKSGTISVQN
ncbi:subtilisin-like protein [Backusella circina FSU 941]|nr:subtilisin-like protein [Backusella circina FSU 941]